MRAYSVARELSRLVRKAQSRPLLWSVVRAVMTIVRQYRAAAGIGQVALKGPLCRGRARERESRDRKSARERARVREKHLAEARAS